MENLVKSQHIFFKTDATKDLRFKKEMLKKLEKSVLFYQDEICDALKADLNKSECESYLSEIQIVLSEIKLALKHIKKWSKPKKVFTPLTHFPGKSYIYNEPFGVTLILSPWNYPFQLSFVPLVGAICGGNCAILKTSKSSPHVSRIIETIIEKTFLPNYIACAKKGTKYDEILAQKYDLIFFTGSERVGKIVMEAAAKNLTPVILELGGKSPCIVEKSADISVAARKIAWGKYLNAGQTCVAPDYVLIDKGLKEAFVKKFEEEIAFMYGDALNNPDYPHIVNKEHFDRLMALINSEHNKYFNGCDAKSLCISPTVFTDASFEDEIMKNEIFGPILPIIPYSNISNALKYIKSKPTPLALYLFTSDRKIEKEIIKSLPFGGGCINDVIMHLANDHLPFGGFGSSGLGNYHGYFSFKAFTREKSIFKSKTFLDIPLRYPPYSKSKFDIIRIITK